MESLRTRDLRAVFEFVEVAWALAGERAITAETLAALDELIPSDEGAYCQLDPIHRRAINSIDATGRTDDVPEVFWEIVDEHPLCRHQRAYADFAATRLSDVISRRRFVDSRVYAEWFRPAGMTAELEAGL